METNDEEHIEPTQETTEPQAKTKKHTTDTRKQIWIITILTSMTDTAVTREMLATGIDIDEWFFALSEIDQDQIIIIHTPKPVSAERIASVLDKILLGSKKKKSKSYQRLFTLCGFDMITSSGGRRNSEVFKDPTLHIENHPGFQRIAYILDVINDGGEEDEAACFHFWIDKKDAGIFALKKNLMLKRLPKRKFSDEIDTLRAENTRLADENTRLKRIMARCGVLYDE